MLFRSFDFLRHYRLSTPGYESKLPWARTGTVPRRLTLGVTLNHKSNLVPSGSIGPPHHMSVGLYEAMGMSTFFSLLRDVETNNRQKYITPSLTTSILPGYCDCAGKCMQPSLHLHPIHIFILCPMPKLLSVNHACKKVCLPSPPDEHTIVI